MRSLAIGFVLGLAAMLLFGGFAIGLSYAFDHPRTATLFLAAFAIGVAVAAYIGVTKLREIDEDVRRSTPTAPPPGYYERHRP